MQRGRAVPFPTSYQCAITSIADADLLAAGLLIFYWQNQRTWDKIYHNKENSSKSSVLNITADKRKNRIVAFYHYGLLTSPWSITRTSAPVQMHTVFIEYQQSNEKMKFSEKKSEGGVRNKNWHALTHCF
ncbi:hypothetical protein CEXT_731231 [Caerostris extrusa]|uniref:Uncharacterized protein n=1 Tax=Caerostris extrusa TaxID=172846 RepID=A0AAV4VYJ7_CAEEX|nr:hypothetical protein CEXT_731231 [Caerostris extrusa]